MVDLNSELKEALNDGSGITKGGTGDKITHQQSLMG
jgi:hypothetical protein